MSDGEAAGERYGHLPIYGEYTDLLAQVITICQAVLMPGAYQEDWTTERVTSIQTSVGWAMTIQPV